MTQNGLEMVRIASGGPGNRFLLYNNAFLYQYKGPFFPIIYYPYSPVKFLILGMLREKQMKWSGGGVDWKSK